jgi:putative membrane-bound dehydrogenase-like protein
MKQQTLKLMLGGLLAASLAAFWINDPESEKRKPENAVKNLIAAEGLQVQLFASEPIMTNPTDMDIDDRGRVWVCEAYNYRPEINGNPVHPEGDRILILEDTDHDGKSDKHTVFYQGPEVASPLGIWVMGNQAIVSQSPYLWLFTDDNGDDKADRKEVILQGIKGDQHDHGLHAVVFGPDGKLYFNFGNAGEHLFDKNNQPILDQDGKAINLQNYKQGMVFRCNPDFTNFEVLGHNFRNNYEVALDSYGTMWQSDNDDDGNKGVRINYVMDYGNYGYTDEVTGAGWWANRTNIETEIPHRHWHLNDPGVVPNLLQTGSGSPCGMAVYEGDLLPEQFRNQPLHAEAGHNVVRAYAKTPDGAGYKAEIINLVESKTDQWFRPSDVCVAPDGSVFIADWYDPGVGGHNAGDQNRGRVFRVAPPSAARYAFEKPNYSTAQGALVALTNPNLSVRYQAWKALQRMGASAESELANMFRYHADDVMRARAFWLLAKGANGAQYVREAANDGNPDMRIAAVRAARQGCAPVLEIVKKLSKGQNAQVRRECALALRHSKSPDAPMLWANLAAMHMGKDRWYLEALGIAADGNWDTYFPAYQKLMGDKIMKSAGGRDVIWRSRGGGSAVLLGQLATDKEAALPFRLRYFRAFDFYTDRKAASAVLLDLVKQNGGNQEIVKIALRHLDTEFVKTTPEAKAALLQLMASLKGEEYVEFADRYQLPEAGSRLFDMILKGDTRHKAADALLKSSSGVEMVKKALKDRKNEAQTLALVDAMQWNGGANQLMLIEQVAFNKKQSEHVRRTAFESLGHSWGGEERILELLKTNKIDKKYIPSAVNGVSNAWRMPVRLEAQRYLTGSTVDPNKPIPDIGKLVGLKGDIASGQQLFEQNCANCHQVNGKGSSYGPGLSEIGDKLPREAQYMAILYPSAGVSFGYEGWEFKLKDGSTVTGLIGSQTETDLVLKMPGGLTQSYKMADVKSKKQMPESMMTAGFHYVMNDQQLADMVEYLMTLKKG